MATGVHDINFVTVPIELLRFGRVGQSRFFLHGETVHIGAEHDSGTWPIFEHGDQPSATNSPVNRVAKCLEFITKTRCGFVFLERQLRVFVEVNKEVFKLAVIERLHVVSQRGCSSELPCKRTHQSEAKSD